MMNDNPQTEVSAQQSKWGARWARFRSGVRKAAPFSAGVLASLAALVLYNVFFPQVKPLSSTQLRQVIDQTMASATPPPAFSTTVYQEIKPSLVLIQTTS